MSVARRRRSANVASASMDDEQSFVALLNPVGELDVTVRNQADTAPPAVSHESSPVHYASNGGAAVSQRRLVYRLVREVSDRILAGILLVSCLPLIAAIGVAVRFDSVGPAFFRQRRVGKHGQPFTILKFRTLRVDAPEYSLKVREGDYLVTRVGRFLRRSGLDELPQLWNVVRGDMALIGPRPEQADLIALYEPWQLKRHLVKPGITGWWQIHHRDGVPLHYHIDKDIYYISNQGPWIDFVILLGTLRIVLGALATAFGSSQQRTGIALIDSAEGESP